MKFSLNTPYFGKLLVGLFLCPAFSIAQVKPNGSTVASATAPALEPASLGGRINYVRTWEPWKPITDHTQVATQTIADVKVSTNYIDGQGRPSQAVIKQGTPSGKDLISYKMYDQYGRESIQPLAYPATVTTGDFRSNPYLEQQTYFSTGSMNNYQYAGEQIYFGKTAFETSPLGRPEKQMEPGNSWAGNNRGVGYQYQLNKSTDAVRIWTIADAAGSTPASSAAYAEGQLNKSITTDEQGNQTVEYTDKEGQVILKKVQQSTSPGVDHTGWLCTYYIYDDYGLLRCVIQPRGVELMSGWVLTSTLLDEQCFRYDYDQRNRMIIKRLPGAGEVHLVYDGRDRIVMTQDPNLRAQNKWLYTTYDGTNRPVSTGVLTSSSTRTTHQTSAYNSTAYPNLGSFTYTEYSHTYYDEYQFAASPFDTQDIAKLSAGTNPWPETVSASTIVYGKQTGSYTGANFPALEEGTTTYYDEKGRVIQVLTNNGEYYFSTVTNRYDFSGKVICNYERTINDLAVTMATINIRTRMLYDGAGRLTKIWKQVNDGTEKLLSEMAYDELGQVKSKRLSPDFNSGAGIETLNFKYNIRNWLKSINEDYTSGTTHTSWFGHTISYDHGFTSQQYDGNISGTQWRTKGDGERRAFGYTYDQAGRLLGADFTQYTSSAWNTTAGLDFTANNLTYDPNGNILTMNQKGWKLGGSSLIDQLSYTYETSSNKLKQVADAVNNFASYLGDFKYDATTKTATDYLYDVNGNLIKDLNKGITDNTYQGIEYNHLNLPVKIRVKDKGIIDYGYDYSGNKLVKKTTDNTINPQRITTTTYYYGLIYQNDSLQFIGHEEGRIRLKGTNEFVYDYFIKDHLGNVRMVLTEEQKTDMYPAATMETASATVEESYYSNLPTTRVNVPSGYPVISGNSKVAKLNGNMSSDPEGIKVGPAIVLKVMAGDKFNLAVNSWWKSGSTPGSPSNPFNELLGAISGSIASQPGAHATQVQLQGSTELSSSVTNFLNSHSGYITTRPKSFINWVLLDERFTYVSSSSGFEQVGTSNTYTSHTRSNMAVEKSGYLYIFVSNSTPNIDVFFDNLQVSHIRGPLLEENHYYPYGLIQSGISSSSINFGNPKNEKKYNEIDLETDFQLNFHDAQFRELDAQIGRWWQIDPEIELMDRWSPYVSNFDNPIIYNDPLGDQPEECCQWLREMLIRASGTMNGAINTVTVGLISSDPLNFRRKLNDEELQNYDQAVELGRVIPFFGVGTAASPAPRMGPRSFTSELVPVGIGPTRISPKSRTKAPETVTQTNATGSSRSTSDQKLIEAAKAAKDKQTKSQERTTKRKEASIQGQNKEGKSNQTVQGEHNSGNKSKANRSDHENANARRQREQEAAKKKTKKNN